MYLIPQPKCLLEGTGHFSFGYGTRIVIASDSTCPYQTAFEYAILLRDEIRRFTGLTLPVVRGEAKGGDFVLFAGNENTEDYTLSITADGVAAKSCGSCGLLYAVQTLRQIIRQCGMILPCMEITDSPDFPARGFYHDVTRGRIETLDNLKKLADRMSFYKLNQLQLYIEHTYLFEDFSEMWRDNTPLTAEEIMELDAYCRKLNIDLVPSLASFGHLYHLMRTKSYGHLCELENPRDTAFSYVDRMAHHTITPAEPNSQTLVLSMIKEYMSLFSSKYFNICGDETFDLGKGKSKELADSIGLDEMYIQFIGKTCEFVVEQGKTPMFWGDIIAKFPEMIKRLPKETICLNWGYSPVQNDDSIRALAECDAIQYVCPGVCCWNHLLPGTKNAYENITRMCDFGKKYNAVGVLNTNWGDFGHVNALEFSIAGMIYGAEFSWSAAKISHEEMNRRISRVEYLDSSESLLALTDSMSRLEIFQWFQLVWFKEHGNPDHLKKRKDMTAACASEQLDKLLFDLKQHASCMDTSARPFLAQILVGAEGIRLFNEVQEVLLQTPFQSNPSLASKLEWWMYQYKQLWRQECKEAELKRIEEVVFWYADRVRG